MVFRVVALVLASLGSGLLAPMPAGSAPEERTVTIEAADGSSFSSTITGAHTRVERVAPDREVLFTLDRPLELRIADPDGSRVALADPLADSADTYRPGDRGSTHIVVADLVAGVTRSYDLDRNVEPEAFGIGIDQLFLVDHRPARRPTSYRVATLLLATGEFEPLVGPDKRALDTDMTGTARQQVTSGSGTQLYTLYLQHGHDDAHGRVADTAELPVAAFVHVLDLAQGWAACVDLPGFGHGPVRAGSIAQSPDGARLFLADTHAREVAVVETRHLDGPTLSVGPPPIETVQLPRAIPRDARVSLTATESGGVIDWRGERYEVSLPDEKSRS